MAPSDETWNAAAEPVGADGEPDPDAARGIEDVLGFELPPPAESTHPAYDIFQHLALQVDTPEEVDRWHAWLQSKDVPVIGPVDHKIIYSIYFHDPNGLRLEFAVDHPDMPSILEQQRPLAHETLQRWLAGDHSSNNVFRPAGH